MWIVVIFQFVIVFKFSRLYLLEYVVIDGISSGGIVLKVEFELMVLFNIMVLIV